MYRHTILCCTIKKLLHDEWNYIFMWKPTTNHGDNFSWMAWVKRKICAYFIIENGAQWSRHEAGNLSQWTKSSIPPWTYLVELCLLTIGNVQVDFSFGRFFGKHILQNGDRRDIIWPEDGLTFPENKTIRHLLTRVKPSFKPCMIQEWTQVTDKYTPAGCPRMWTGSGMSLALLVVSCRIGSRWMDTSTNELHVHQY